MPLTLRPAGLSSPAYRDWLDYVIVEDGRDVGRLYEDRHSKPELRWFWSYVNPRRGIITSGRAASLDEAKAQFPVIPVDDRLTSGGRSPMRSKSWDCRLRAGTCHQHGKAGADDRLSHTTNLRGFPPAA
jgi:hypothetical protein